MAERRMFSKKIVESDAFLDMPATAQILYFHMAMEADDDGFVNNVNKIRRYCGASAEDIQALIDLKFVIKFDSGVFVIKHWRMQNQIKSDRYKRTVYVEELAQLYLKENKAYTLDGSKMDPNCIQPGSTVKDSIEQYSLDQNSIDKERIVDCSFSSKRPLKLSRG